MSHPTPDELTVILDNMRGGDPAARERLLNLVYEDLHALAAAKMKGESGDDTLQTTGLVHEAYLRLFGQSDPSWDNRGHFFGAAAQVMRRILVDRARMRMSQKRGGDRSRVSLDEIAESADEHPEHLLAVDTALSRLEEIEPDKAAMVRLRFFAGLSAEEAAAALGISLRTAMRHWRFAKAWLYREIGDA